MGWVDMRRIDNRTVCVVVPLVLFAATLLISGCNQPSSSTRQLDA